MKILITGAGGFIAKHLIEYLKKDDSIELYLYYKGDSLNILETYIKDVDFIFHLAGVNRTKNITKFYEGNSELTKDIVNKLIKDKKNTPVLLSSSVQSTIDSDYGKSKLEAENILVKYAKEANANIYIYRLPNIFGKWSKPNYNSVISTWCHNIANDLEIQVNNEDTQLDLVYIDDVIKSFIEKLDTKSCDKYFKIDTVYKKSLGNIKELLYKFKEDKHTLITPNVASGFEKVLYTTYLNYLPTCSFSNNDNSNEYIEVFNDKKIKSNDYCWNKT